VHRRVIVITGASSGIGEHAARQLARKGHFVCLVARRHDELARVHEKIVRDGGEAAIYAADLSVGSEVDACATAILAAHGPVDVLVNNAGRSIKRSIRASLSRDHDFQRTMQINYFAAVRLTMRLLPAMLENRRGHIVNITSMSVQVATPGYAAYTASKAALEGYSRCLAAELVDSGVDVTLIRYPLVRTPMSEATDTYKNARLMSPETAAGWIVDAVEKRPARVSTLWGGAIEAANVLMPGTTQRWTGRIFKYMGKMQKRGARHEKGPE
jgi:short-subunit dehydrogenase